MTLLQVMDNTEIFARVMQDLVHEKMRDDGLNKSEIAEGLGIAPQTLSGYLKGKHIPEYNRLLEIAKYFNSPVSRLMGETAVANPTIITSDNRHTDNKLTEEDYEILRLRDKLPPGKQAEFLEFIRMMAKLMGKED